MSWFWLWLFGSSAKEKDEPGEMVDFDPEDFDPEDFG